VSRLGYGEGEGEGEGEGQARSGLGLRGGHLLEGGYLGLVLECDGRPLLLL